MCNLEYDPLQCQKIVTCARNYRPCFRENQPKRSFSIKWKRAFWACFRENWVYKFGHWFFSLICCVRTNTNTRQRNVFYLSLFCVLQNKISKTKFYTVQASTGEQWVIQVIIFISQRNRTYKSTKNSRNLLNTNNLFGWFTRYSYLFFGCIKLNPGHSGNCSGNTILKDFYVDYVEY